MLGQQFEDAVIAALPELQGLNIEPGSLRVDLIADPTTVRVTVVVDADAAVVRQAALGVLDAAG